MLKISVTYEDYIFSEKVNLIEVSTIDDDKTRKIFLSEKEARLLAQELTKLFPPEEE